MTADQIIAALNLAPHPEGGHYRQTWAAETVDADGRPTATAILFLLRSGETSHWHKVDADEIWLFHAGAPLHLRTCGTDTGPADLCQLTGDPATGAQQVRVPAHHWQSARSTGAFSLVSCLVSPGFRFEGFTLAPPGFDIPDR